MTGYFVAKIETAGNTRKWALPMSVEPTDRATADSRILELKRRHPFDTFVIIGEIAEACGGMDVSVREIEAADVLQWPVRKIAKA